MNSTSAIPGQFAWAPEYTVKEAYPNVMPESVHAQNLTPSDATSEKEYQEDYPGYDTGRPLVLKDNPWFSEEDLNQLKNTFSSLNRVVHGRGNPGLSRRSEGLLMNLLFQFTKSEFAPVFNGLEDETAEFVKERGLIESVAWLQTATPRFFGGANFEIDLLPAVDGEDNLLALNVYGAFDAAQFRDRRHRICGAMLEAGHNGLHEVISISQRRTHNSGRQAFSWYSTISAE